jgi:hypothetical protein
MTERRRPSVWTTAIVSLGAFLIVLTLLAWQLHSGEDPALAAGKQGAAARKQVIVRKVVRRVVVTRVAPAPAPSVAVSGAAGPAPSGSSSSSPSPAPSAPAPVQVAPVQPAPAPAPAPVTRAS